MPLSKGKRIILAIVGVVLAFISAYGVYVFKSSQAGSPRPDSRKPPDSSKPVKYAGRVMNRNNKVIVGAKISVELEAVPQIYYTDTEGIFYLNVPPQIETTRIRIEATGYEVEYRNVSIYRTGIEDIYLTSSANDSTLTRPELPSLANSGKDSNASTGKARRSSNSGKALKAGKQKKGPYDLLNFNGQ